MYHVIENRNFRNIVKKLYVDFNAAPRGVPGALVIYQEYYAVFETVPILHSESIFFDVELWKKYSDRMFKTERAYQHKKNGKFESEKNRKEIINYYSELNYVVDDLTEYPQFKENCCWWCGRPLDGRPDKNYCSKACGNAFRAFTQSDEYNLLMRMNDDGAITNEDCLYRLNNLRDRINKDHEYRKCPVCGAPVKRSNAKFCCDQCRYEYHNKMKKLGK